MSEDPRTRSLHEWNDLARENTENAIISSMFESMAKAIDPMDSFSTWLLAGTAAIASFLIANGEKLIPLMTKDGFIWCGLLLCLSCVFGLFAKIYALRSKISVEVNSLVRSTLTEHLTSYEQQEKMIKEGAEFWGITLETGVRLERLLKEFYSAFPKWVAWLAYRHINKHKNNPQVGYLLMINNINKQGYFVFAQAITFLSFLFIGFFFAAST